jgi:hypothetical protein
MVGSEGWNFNSFYEPVDGEEARRLQAERARECLFTPTSFVTLLRAVLMSIIRGWGQGTG